MRHARCEQCEERGAWDEAHDVVRLDVQDDALQDNHVEQGGHEVVDGSEEPRVLRGVDSL